MDFFTYLCSQRVLLIVLHAGGWIGMVLNTITILFVDRAGEIIIMLNYFGLLVLILWTGYVLWKCNQIHPVSSPVRNG